MNGEIPESIRRRPKQPYRAPDSVCFFGPNAPEYAKELLSEDAISNAGLFDGQAVGRLIKKLERSSGRPVSARDDMALVGILSTQLLHHHFIDNFASRVSEAREVSSKLNIRVFETGGEALAGETPKNREGSC